MPEGAALAQIWERPWDPGRGWPPRAGLGLSAVRGVPCAGGTALGGPLSRAGTQAPEKLWPKPAPGSIVGARAGRTVPTAGGGTPAGKLRWEAPPHAARSTRTATPHWQRALHRALARGQEQAGGSVGLPSCSFKLWVPLRPPRESLAAQGHHQEGGNAVCPARPCARPHRPCRGTRRAPRPRASRCRPVLRAPLPCPQRGPISCLTGPGCPRHPLRSPKTGAGEAGPAVPSDNDDDYKGTRAPLHRGTCR